MVVRKHLAVDGGYQQRGRPSVERRRGHGDLRASQVVSLTGAQRIFSTRRAVWEWSYGVAALMRREHPMTREDWPGSCRCGKQTNGDSHTKRGHMSAIPPTMALIGMAVVAAVITGCTAAPRSDGHPAPAPTGTIGPGSSAEANSPGDIPDNQVFVEFTAPDRSYTIKYPEGWTRTDHGSTVVFGDTLNSITIAPHNGFYRPTEDYARTAELPQIATQTAGFAPGQISIVQRPAGPVVLITYQQDSAPNPVTTKTVRQQVERYEYTHLGRGVIVTLSAPVGSDNTDPWRTVTDSFTWLR